MSGDPYGSFTHDGTPPDDEGGFDPLEAGDYALRVTAFSRSESKNHNPQLVFRTRALIGPSEGSTLWFLTLTDKAVFFVKQGVHAVRPQGYEGVRSLWSDDDVKELFLGRVFRAKVTNRTFTDKDGNRKISDRIDTVWPALASDLGDHPHEDPKTYWDNQVFKEKDKGGGKSQGGGGSQSKSPTFDDDEIPFGLAWLAPLGPALATAMAAAETLLG